MRSIGVIARLTLREAVRRKVAWGLLLLSVVFLTLYTLGLVLIQNEVAGLGRNAVPARIGGINAIYNFFVMAALYAANFLIVMLAVLVSVDTLAGEIGSGTIQSVAVKPLQRRDIVAGKWLGFVVLLALCTTLLVGGVLLITLVITHYLPPNPWSGLLLMFLEALVFLSVSLLGGTRLSTLANGVLGFGLFGLAFIGAFIEQIGGFIEQYGANGGTTAIQIGHLASLIMPSEVLWRRALADMAEGLNPIRMMTIGASTPDNSVIAYAIAYAALILLLAFFSFQRRDL